MPRPATATLKANKKVIISVDYNDLDKFISDRYGIDFECVADQEWSNYESHEITVGKQELTAIEQKDFLHYLKNKGHGMFMLRLLLTDLCNDDLIDAGDYVIKVFW